MGICELCDRETEDTFNCSQCGAEVCFFCGDAGAKICDTCKERVGDDEEMDFEEDY